MNFILILLRGIYVTYAAAIFLAIMFVILPFIFLVSFQGRLKGGNIMAYFMRIWAHIWFAFSGIWCKRIYQGIRKRETCIYVVNHRSYLDAALAAKVMGLPFRSLGKVEMGKIPFFGFIYKKTVVTVDRSSAMARARSVREMMNTLKANISILIFPEGTFNESDQPLREFHNGAFRMAIETQTPIKPVLFVDTAIRLPRKGLLYLSPGPCRVVFLPTVPVTGLSLSDVEDLKQQVFDTMDAALRTYHHYPNPSLQLAG
jgi:1-acyl-sn-glycerol-3-phosphate acyltransferase